MAYFYYNYRLYIGVGTIKYLGGGQWYTVTEYTLNYLSCHSILNEYVNNILVYYYNKIHNPGGGGPKS